MKVAIGLSDWPEERSKDFVICSQKFGETTDELLTRARSYYPSVTVEIRELAELKIKSEME